MSAQQQAEPATGPVRYVTAASMIDCTGAAIR
jgi:hypothetical protein